MLQPESFGEAGRFDGARSAFVGESVGDVNCSGPVFLGSENVDRGEPGTEDPLGFLQRETALGFGPIRLSLVDNGAVDFEGDGVASQCFKAFPPSHCCIVAPEGGCRGVYGEGRKEVRGLFEFCRVLVFGEGF